MLDITTVLVVGACLITVAILMNIAFGIHNFLYFIGLMASNLYL